MMGLLQKKIQLGFLAPGTGGLLGRSGVGGGSGAAIPSTAGQAIGLLLILTKAS